PDHELVQVVVLRNGDRVAGVVAGDGDDSVLQGANRGGGAPAGFEGFHRRLETVLLGKTLHDRLQGRGRGTRYGRVLGCGPARECRALVSRGRYMPVRASAAFVTGSFRNPKTRQAHGCRVRGLAVPVCACSEK